MTLEEINAEGERLNAETRELNRRKGRLNRVAFWIIVAALSFLAAGIFFQWYDRA